MKRKIANAKPIPGYEESQAQMDPADRIFVDKSAAIGHYLEVLLQLKGLRQKDLAELLGKSEPEISKWLAGMHNYTLRTLSKLEAALGSDIVFVPTNIGHSSRVASPQITESGTYQIAARQREQTESMGNLSYSKSWRTKIEDNTNESLVSKAA